MGKRRKMLIKYRKKHGFDYINGSFDSTTGKYWIDLGNSSLFRNMLIEGIREITENLATAGLGDPIDKSKWQVIDVFREIDDNDTRTYFIKQKILLASKLLDKGYKVCVRCAAGMNRSNNIATAVLVYRDKTSSIYSSWTYWRKVVKNKVDRSLFMSSLLSNTCIQALLELEEDKIGN